MIALFADVRRSAPVGPVTWRTWAGLIVLPVLVMTLFLWAFWAPQSNHGAAKAAVVNNDRPVSVDGQTIPLGRQLAGNLATSRTAYTWVLTDATDARDGLARGDYGAVVTIPEDFSAKATSSANPNPLDAGQAEVRVQTSNATGVADPVVSTQIAQAVLHTLNQQIVQTYLDKVYLSFSTMHDQLDKAAQAASQLAGGADQLSNGATRLSTGTGRLSAGLNSAQSQAADAKTAIAELQRQLRLPPPPVPTTAQIERLAAGLDSIVSGVNQANDGAHQLDNGLHQLAGGAHQLATQLAQGRDQVPVYSQAQRDRLSNVAATPAIAVTDGTNLGAAVAAVAVTLALWACALSTYVATRALPSAVLNSRESTRRIVVRAAAPGMLIALAAALTLSLILIPVLHLGAGRWFSLLGVTALTALSFTAINQAATAIFERPGRLACITVLVLAIVTSLTSTIPPTLHSIGNHLPTHAAIMTLRGVMIGSDTTASGVVELFTWLLGGAVATLLVTEQRRTLDSKQLRLGRIPSAAS